MKTLVVRGNIITSRDSTLEEKSIILRIEEEESLKKSLIPNPKDVEEASFSLKFINNLIELGEI